MDSIDPCVSESELLNKSIVPPTDVVIGWKLERGENDADRVRHLHCRQKGKGYFAKYTGLSVTADIGFVQ